ncbi:DNA-binding protein [Halarcobacter sp.]|uniref:DNA-binding protein n=1 Tax=Halarcobacter TaxID=2321115 RepID=UPI003A8E6D3A
MERLVTTAQAAQILGLSLQGVHYRIKKNQLKSIKKSGKTYVYIPEYIQDQTSNEEPKVELKQETFNGYEEVIKVKDEQIDLLKKSVKWMKKQYSSEIYRLEKNQKRIITVFNREIELLQSAFNEMRSIYKQPQIETVQQTQNNEEEKERFISLLEFTLYLKKHNKSEKDIKLIILKAIQQKDSRFIYNRKDKKLLILNEDFSDLI